MLYFQATSTPGLPLNCLQLMLKKKQPRHWNRSFATHGIQFLAPINEMTKPVIKMTKAWRLIVNLLNKEMHLCLTGMPTNIGILLVVRWEMQQAF